MIDLTPGSPEWRKRITASKVAAILGLSTYASPRSMWHMMHGDLSDEAQTSVQARGHYLEPAILRWWLDRHGIDDQNWSSQPLYLLDDWAAAQPDAAACHPEDDTVLVEAKSTNSLDLWGEPGTDEIPLPYFVQCQFQMHVSGVHRCYVPIIGPRLEFAEYVVDYLPDDAPILEKRMREFYDSLAADEPPPLDDTVATYDAVRKVHRDIDTGASVELTREQADDVVTFQHLSKEADRSLRLAKSTVLDAMGRAQYATYQGVRIARRQPDGPDRTKFVVVGEPADLTALETAS